VLVADGREDGGQVAILYVAVVTRFDVCDAFLQELGEVRSLLFVSFEGVEGSTQQAIEGGVIASGNFLMQSGFEVGGQVDRHRRSARHVVAILALEQVRPEKLP